MAVNLTYGVFIHRKNLSFKSFLSGNTQEDYALIKRSNKTKTCLEFSPYYQTYSALPTFC